MVATKKPNTGTKPKAPKRKARESDREHAADLARRYWEEDPYRIEIDGETFLSDVDGDALARELMRFAKEGTFEMPASAVTFERAQMLPKEVEYLHATQNVPVHRAIDLTAKKWKVSKQTVIDALYGRKNRKIDIPADGPQGIDEVVLDPLYCRKIRKA